MFKSFYVEKKPFDDSNPSPQQPANQEGAGKLEENLLSYTYIEDVNRHKPNDEIDAADDNLEPLLKYSSDRVSEENKSCVERGYHIWQIPSESEEKHWDGLCKTCGERRLFPVAVGRKRNRVLIELIRKFSHRGPTMSFGSKSEQIYKYRYF